MKFSLRLVISLSYLLIIVLCVGIIIGIANAVLERQFQSYVIRQQQQQANEIIALIAQRYQAADRWDEQDIESIGINAMNNGLIIRVTDAQGTVVWDAQTHNQGFCDEMLMDMSQKMTSRYGNWEGGYEENLYPIVIGGQDAGTVSIGYYGPFFYTDSDLYFLRSINTLIIWAGVVSAVLALFIGFFVSKKISSPIRRVIEKARRIAQGSYGDNIIETSRTLEITQLVDTVNELAESLKKQEARSRQASSDIAHELRTPLAAIQGNLEAVMDGVMELDENRLSLLHEEVLRISRLVEDLSRLSKFEHRDTRISRSLFDVNELIRDVAEGLRDAFVKEGKELIFTGWPSLMVSADRDRIKQVVINLLSNALKFTRSGDRTEITLADRGGQIEIRVRDTGTGIPEEDLPFIFDRFYRADKSRSRRTGGAGIGLTIVKSLVEAHGGTITVSSRPGSGTEFIVTLPGE